MSCGWSRLHRTLRRSARRDLAFREAAAVARTTWWQFIGDEQVIGTVKPTVDFDKDHALEFYVPTDASMRLLAATVAIELGASMEWVEDFD